MRFLSIVAALLFAVSAHCQSSIGGKVSPDGAEEIRIDLPEVFHVKNRTGTDGAGLCVWASGKMAGSWGGEPSVCKLFEKLQHEEGGGWPQRVDDEMRDSCPGVRYMQHTGGDPAVLKAVVSSGRIACITYGYSPRYRGPINHMVCAVHFSDRWGAVIDCNFPNTVEWMPSAELVKRWKYGRGGGWLWALCAVPPPPVPSATPFRVQQVPDQRWVQVAPGSDWFDVWMGGTYLGRWQRPDTDKRLSAKPSPEQESEVCTRTDHGVVCNKFSLYGDTYCGYRLAPGQLMAALTKEGMVPDDTKKNYLAIVAGDIRSAECLAALKADPEAAAYLSRCKVRCIEPGNPLIADTRLATGHDFNLVLMGPEDVNGRANVLHRQCDFDGGAKQFMEAVRRADPTYRPENDADLRKAQPKKKNADNDQVEGGQPWYLNPWLIGAGLSVLWLLVPSPVKPFVSALQAIVAGRGNGAPLDLGPLAERLKAIEAQLEGALKKKD